MSFFTRIFRTVWGSVLALITLMAGYSLFYELYLAVKWAQSDRTVLAFSPSSQLKAVLDIFFNGFFDGSPNWFTLMIFILSGYLLLRILEKK